MQTISVERLPLSSLRFGIALAKDWDRMLSTASSPIPELRTRQGYCQQRNLGLIWKVTAIFPTPKTSFTVEEGEG